MDEGGTMAMHLVFKSPEVKKLGARLPRPSRPAQQMHIACQCMNACRQPACVAMHVDDRLA